MGDKEGVVDGLLRNQRDRSILVTVRDNSSCLISKTLDKHGLCGFTLSLPQIMQNSLHRLSLGLLRRKSEDKRREKLKMNETFNVL